MTTKTTNAMTQQTEQICFRYDGSEEAKKCIEWINSIGTNRGYLGTKDCYYDINGYNGRILNPTTHRLVTPAEFLRLVNEPQWKVGDECEFGDNIICKIKAIDKDKVWLNTSSEHDIIVLIEHIRPIRKSVREEIAKILMMPFFTADQILDIIKQRKDEL